MPVHETHSWNELLRAFGLALLIMGPFVAWLIRAQRKQNRELQAKIQEREAELEWERRPDPAAVLTQRRLFRDGEFRRKITGWTPHSLHDDRGELSCGHIIRRSSKDHDQEADCLSCAREYLKNARLKHHQDLVS